MFNTASSSLCDGIKDDALNHGVGVQGLVYAVPPLVMVLTTNHREMI
jgi:hypothetical protein